MPRVLSLLLAAWLTGAAAPALAGAADPHVHVDRIVIDKSQRLLTLLSGTQAVKRYTIALGAAPKGAKHFEGDHRTPEGVYAIDYRNAHSKYHLALRISYPNESDRMRAMDAGRDPGGEIMIHGLKNGQGWLGKRHLGEDWTDGCIAVTNAQIEEIWSLVSLGTPVEIRP